MSKPPETATSEIVVHLVRPGDPVRTYHLSKGASLADFLNLIGTSRTDEKIFVQGVPIEESAAIERWHRRDDRAAILEWQRK